MSLNHVDRQILALLQQDASLSTAEIADKVGLSQSPCWRRIAKLEQDGYIKSKVIISQGIEGYEHFVRDNLLSLEYVQEVHSNVTMTCVKRSTALPL